MVMTVEQRNEFLETLYEPRYATADPKGPIALTGIFEGYKVTFWASPRDPMEYGRKIYDRILKGEYGEISDYTPPIKNLASSNPSELETKKDLF
jgi:hypothetical protein